MCENASTCVAVGVGAAAASKVSTETPDHRMRLRSGHPGVTVEQIVEATGFELVIPADVDETRQPTEEELRLIREIIDPNDLRKTEVKP